MQPNDASLSAQLVALALAHRPLRSWPRGRVVCSCGQKLPCRELKALPVDRSAQPGAGR